jgi:NAD(P)-dependent dehydrogenase (short-subunit alcohol dehydrogenase family)
LRGQSSGSNHETSQARGLSSPAATAASAWPTARLFVAEGAQVAITGRDQKTLDEAIAELGPNARGYRADVTITDDGRPFARHLAAIPGRVSFAVRPGRRHGNSFGPPLVRHGSHNLALNHANFVAGDACGGWRAAVDRRGFRF